MAWVSLALAVLSLSQVLRAGRERREDDAQARHKGHEPDVCRHPDCQQLAQVLGCCLMHLNRGDFSLWVCIALSFLGAAYPIIVAKTLFPVLVTTSMLAFILTIAFVYAPLISFVSARLDGLIGQTIQIPHLQEATVFLTEFRGVEIWFVDLAGATWAVDKAHWGCGRPPLAVPGERPWPGLNSLVRASQRPLGSAPRPPGAPPACPPPRSPA